LRRSPPTMPVAPATSAILGVVLTREAYQEVRAAYGHWSPGRVMRAVDRHLC
jgi:hypothetical protein